MDPLELPIERVRSSLVETVRYQAAGKLNILPQRAPTSSIYDNYICASQYQQRLVQSNRIDRSSIQSWLFGVDSIFDQVDPLD